MVKSGPENGGQTAFQKIVVKQHSRKYWSNSQKQWSNRPAIRGGSSEEKGEKNGQTLQESEGERLRRRAFFSSRYMAGQMFALVKCTGQMCALVKCTCWSSVRAGQMHALVKCTGQMYALVKCSHWSNVRAGQMLHWSNVRQKKHNCSKEA